MSASIFDALLFIHPTFKIIVPLNCLFDYLNCLFDFIIVNIMLYAMSTPQHHLTSIKILIKLPGPSFHCRGGPPFPGRSNPAAVDLRFSQHPSREGNPAVSTADT
jgi:hypothetical protein